MLRDAEVSANRCLVHRGRNVVFIMYSIVNLHLKRLSLLYFENKILHLMDQLPSTSAQPKS